MYYLRDIFLAYGDRVLFDNISLSFNDGDKIGLSGRNGAGKSTLLKLIANRIQPGSGTIEYPQSKVIGFLSQDIEEFDDTPLIEEASSALENVVALKNKIDSLNEQLQIRTDYTSEAYLDIVDDLSDATTKFEHIGGYSAEAKVQSILTGLGFSDSDMQKATSKFSGGWQMRISLAKILLKDPDLLLLDEPTNHLDIDSIIWLEKWLKDSSSTVILISHDTQFLDNITKRTIEIENGKVYDYAASYTEYRKLRKERREMLEAAYVNQQKLIAQKERTIERFRAKATKAKMAKSMEKQLDRIDRIELDDVNLKDININFQDAPRSGLEVVKVSNISKSFKANNVLRGVDFRLERGEKVAFVGQNGQGKTTLAKIIMSEFEVDSGSVEIGYNVDIGYYAQDQSAELESNKTLLETMQDKAPREWQPRLRSLLGAFLFSGEDIEKKVSVLSGGERARLALAQLLMFPYNLLILDEPTNHLDIFAKEVLKDALQEYNGSMIVVSHDRDFLEGLTDKTIEFRNKKLHTHLGGLEEFLRKRETRNMRDIEASDPKKNKSGSTKSLNTDQKIAVKKLEKQLKSFEKKMDRKEQEISKLEEKMAKPGFYESENAEEIMEEHKNSKNQLSEINSGWEKTFEALEEFES